MPRNNTPTEYDFDISQIIDSANNKGFFHRRLVRDNDLGKEMIQLFTAAQIATFKQAADPLDPVSLQQSAYVHTIAMMDVFLGRHPELVSLLELNHMAAIESLGESMKRVTGK